MRTALTIGIAAFMLADTFFMWCLLRAHAQYEQNEPEVLTEREAREMEQG